MALTRTLYRTKDNVECQLNAGIGASDLAIPLKSGHGAQLPSALKGAATSGGDSNSLNSTGIQAALSGIAAVGDIIENVTDGSVAVILSISTNAIETTRLRGGSDNTWSNADVWAVNRFVATAIHYDTDGTTILKREKILIDSRSGDNLTVNASGRGFDGSTAQSFATDDYIYLFWTTPQVDGVLQMISQLAQDINNLISQGSGEVYAADGGGTDSYAITLVPAPTSYVTGAVYNFKANTANTGAASLNVNGLGAKTIKKNHDQDLEDNDIESGQIVTVAYDGTNFQMQSQIANVFASKSNVQKNELVYGEPAVGTDSYAYNPSPAFSAYVAGMRLTFKADVANTGAATLNINSLGAKTIKKNYNQDLATGDIVAGQIVEVVYDGTNFQLVSSFPQSKMFVGSGLRNGSTGTQAITGVGFTPRLVIIQAVRTASGYTGWSSGSATSASDDTCINWSSDDTNRAGADNSEASNPEPGYIIVCQNPSGGAYAQLQSMDSDGFTLNWTTYGGSGQVNFIYQCFG